MFEVEQKYPIDDVAKVEHLLQTIGASEQPVQNHADTYYNHPCRDFAETTEAFRIRRVDGVPMVTYKGKKLPGKVKARRELEWRLDPGDSDGSKMEELLGLLSFQQVAVVKKQRRTFLLQEELADFTVVIDSVASLGCFAEIELVVRQQSEVQHARDRIESLANQLNLLQAEPRSYLRMILEQNPS